MGAFQGLFNGHIEYIGILKKCESHDELKIMCIMSGFSHVIEL